MLANARSYLRSSFWGLPALIVLIAIITALALMAAEEQVAPELRSFVFAGAEEGARSVLSTIASAMITFTGLVFSITVLVLQLTSAQYSPRALRRFSQDRSNQIALGTFTATFTFALVVLTQVETNNEDGVPRLAVAAAIVLVLVSVGVFVHYIHHIVKEIQITSIIASVGKESRDIIDQLFPEGEPDQSEEAIPLPEAPSIGLVPSPRHGALVRVDEGRLIEAAKEADAVVEVIPMTGDFVPEGYPLLRMYGRPLARAEDPGWVAGSVTLGRDRTMDQDLAFGFRQLVDIAEKALSPGINDPTTAVQALDQIHELLRRLARRRFPPSMRCDDEGSPRLLLRRASWEDFVELAVDEIRRYGADSLQVNRRLQAMLADLLAIAPPFRRAPLRTQLALVEQSADRSFQPGHDRELAAEPDLQGIGS